MEKMGIDELATFCKRKGFVYPSGEIYGGLAGFWDYGPLGVEFKNNIKSSWWNFHVRQREDIAGIDGSVITNPKVWKASGHVDNFTDVYVKCKKCKKAAKIDKKDVGKARCEFCSGEYEIIGNLNLMFSTQVGPVASEGNKAYLRPETAQLIFADFKLVQENARLQLPFGIAQIGKAFRNEISPRDFLFRCREFEQMEIEYFIHPEKRKECPYIQPYENFELNVYSEEMQNKKKKPEKMKVKDALKKGIIKLAWHAYWLALETEWFLSLGADKSKFRVRQHLSEERSHYATDTWDLEYEFPFGWKELQGIADRGSFDLSQHEKHSGKDLHLYDEETKKKVLAEVVAEPSLGVERAFLVFLFDAYNFDKKRENVVLKLHAKLAPIKASVLPIVKDEKMTKIARDIVSELRKEWNVSYDESGSIGRRYSRADESGTPMCIAIDEDSIKSKTCTIRDRDTTKQVRVKISELPDVVRKVISGESVLKLGKLVETRVKE
jgi:glycyl-tRNA synthetase